MKISVIGCGAWGTEVARLLSEHEKGDICLWVNPEETFDGKQLSKLIKEAGVNEKYLPGFPIPHALEITDSLEMAVIDADILISAIPSEYLMGLARVVGDFVNTNQVIITLTKGVEYDEINKKFKRMSEVLQETLALPYENFVAVSGPNLAVEIARGLPTSTVVAGMLQENVNIARNLFNCPPLLKAYKPKKQDDIIGVELGGALKNPYAIAGGICGFLSEMGKAGDNSKAALKTRCLNEMINFAELFGADRTTLTGLAGDGDLTLCFYSNRSRNYQYGYSLAREAFTGEEPQEIKGVVEGKRTVKEINKYTQERGCDMNIMRQVYAVVYGLGTINEAINSLMTRNTEVE